MLAAVFLRMMRLEVNGRTEQPPHLLLKAPRITARAPAGGIKPKLSDEAGESVTHLQAALSRPHRFRVQPEQQKARKAAIGVANRCHGLRVKAGTGDHEDDVAIRTGPHRNLSWVCVG